MKKKLIVAISGASGAIYAKILLDLLSKMKNQYETLGVVMSNNAKDVWKHELDMDFESYRNTHYDFQIYEKNNFYAPFASGSAKYEVMIICPCSMGTLGRIAAGVSDDLVTRAADVILKERRKLILAIRETPLNLIHLKNMETIMIAGGIICPASPSYYSKPSTIDALASTVIYRILDLAGLETESYRWGQQDSSS